MAGRRGWGEGSIFRRKRDGLWVAVSPADYSTGKRVRKAYYGKTRREVASRLAAFLRDQEMSRPKSAGLMMLRDLERRISALEQRPASATRRSSKRGSRFTSLEWEAMLVFARLGLRPECQLTIAGKRVDFLLDDLIVEIDGPLHDMPINEARDRETDGELRAAGFSVLRLRWDERLTWERQLKEAVFEPDTRAEIVDATA